MYVRVVDIDYVMSMTLQAGSNNQRLTSAASDSITFRLRLSKT